MKSLTTTACPGSPGPDLGRTTTAEPVTPGEGDLLDTTDPNGFPTPRE